MDGVRGRDEISESGFEESELTSDGARTAWFEGSIMTTIQRRSAGEFKS